MKQNSGVRKLRRQSAGPADVIEMPVRQDDGLQIEVVLTNVIDQLLRRLAGIDADRLAGPLTGNDARILLKWR